MLRNKPVRQPGQDIRTLPTFTIPEAAEALAIKPRTMFSWYEGDDPILKASGAYGSIHLLSGFAPKGSNRARVLAALWLFVNEVA